MTEYPTDIALNRDRDIHLNDANDLAVVEGKDSLEQSTALSASEAIKDFVGNRLSGTNIALFEERLRRKLKDNEMIDNVDDITVKRYDERDDSITVEVKVSENENFEMEVSV